MDIKSKLTHSPMLYTTIQPPSVELLFPCWSLSLRRTIFQFHLSLRIRRILHCRNEVGVASVDMDSSKLRPSVQLTLKNDNKILGFFKRFSAERKFLTAILLVRTIGTVHYAVCKIQMKLGADQK